MTNKKISKLKTIPILICVSITTTFIIYFVLMIFHSDILTFTDAVEFVDDNFWHFYPIRFIPTIIVLMLIRRKNKRIAANKENIIGE